MQALAKGYGSILWIATFFLCWISVDYPIAQTGTTGSITVIVQDPSGAILTDAALELRDRGTNDVRNGSTQQSGAYSQPSVWPVSTDGYRAGLSKGIVRIDSGSNGPCHRDQGVPN